MGFHDHIMKLSLGISRVFTSVCVVAAWYSFYIQNFLIRLSFPHPLTSLFRLLLVLTESHGKYSELIRSEVLYVSGIGAVLDSFGKCCYHIVFLDLHTFLDRNEIMISV